ncbi:MAG: serine/threonine-protein kinase [Geitlerinemataceae cyanobacterium]
MVTTYSDFSSYHYQVVRELGRNPAGGRIAYLATDTRSQRSVAIKQFRFANFGSDWSGYDNCEREIQILRELNHPGIPQYLDSFETSDGFCLVQEYKPALSLAQTRSFASQDIKKIAIALLEILVYLQDRFPPIIHRDIKPENILVGETDEDGNLPVYLVDFGFARIGKGEVALSSIVKGTLGFMPPEQLFNRPLTEASDLYGVGASLICILTGTKSIDIGNLMDSNYRINFQDLVPQLSLPWIAWLETMVQPNAENRYGNAAAALKALQPIYVTRSPSISFVPPTIEFRAKKLGEKVTQTIVLKNPIPDTILSGHWEFTPHQNDPPHPPQSHPWISISPDRFEANQMLCKITVYTGKLMANKRYDRDLILNTNTAESPRSIRIKVKTAPVPLKVIHPPLTRLSILLGVSFVFAFKFSFLGGLSIQTATSIARLIDKLISF